MIFNAEVNHEGKLIIFNRDSFDSYIKRLKNKKITINIKQKRAIRSLNQNALYWLWLGALEDYTGFKTEDWHATFKSMFLIDRSRGYDIVRSTTNLNKLEFGFYLDKIKKYCSNNEVLKVVEFPDPNSENYV